MVWNLPDHLYSPCPCSPQVHVFSNGAQIGRLGRPAAPLPRGRFGGLRRRRTVLSLGSWALREPPWLLCSTSSCRSAPLLANHVREIHATNHDNASLTPRSDEGSLAWDPSARPPVKALRPPVVLAFAIAFVVVVPFAAYHLAGRRGAVPSPFHRTLHTDGSRGLQHQPKHVCASECVVCACVCEIVSTRVGRVRERARVCGMCRRRRLRGASQSRAWSTACRA